MLFAAASISSILDADRVKSALATFDRISLQEDLLQQSRKLTTGGVQSSSHS